MGCKTRTLQFLSENGNRSKFRNVAFSFFKNSELGDPQCHTPWSESFRMCCLDIYSQCPHIAVGSLRVVLIFPIVVPLELWKSLTGCTHCVDVCYPERETRSCLVQCHCVYPPVWFCRSQQNVEKVPRFRLLNWHCGCLLFGLLVSVSIYTKFIV
jgi:hypothetical protein